MYDDYEFHYEYNNESYTLDLDEIYEHYIHTSYNTQDTYEIDDEYARDTCDYDALAYKHYAWYHIHITHRTRIMYTHKRIVCVTLDIECYDDLYLEDLDWKSLLDLEGDENVHVSIKEPAEVYWVPVRRLARSLNFWYEFVSDPPD
jgi:hypothetical protein